MLKFLDFFLFVFHTILVFFILFGWAWKKTRLLNLVVILLTAGSWGILGIRLGFGYCPFTDWHWRIRMELGHHDLPSSYIKFLADALTGMDWDVKTLRVMTVGGLTAALSASLYTNIRDYRNRRAAAGPSR